MFYANLNSYFRDNIGHPLFFEPKHAFTGDFFNLSPEEQKCDVHNNVASLIADLRSSGHVE